MKFDRNTIIGFAILALLFIGYFWTTSREQAKYREKLAKEKHIKDSIANANRPTNDTIALKKDSLKTDSFKKAAVTGIFKKPGADTEKLVYINTGLVKIAFSNKGGQPKWVDLKKFRNQDS